MRYQVFPAAAPGLAPALYVAPRTAPSPLQPPPSRGFPSSVSSSPRRGLPCTCQHHAHSGSVTRRAARKKGFGVGRTTESEDRPAPHARLRAHPRQTTVQGRAGRWARVPPCTSPRGRRYTRVQTPHSTEAETKVQRKEGASPGRHSNARYAIPASRTSPIPTAPGLASPRPASRASPGPRARAHSRSPPSLSAAPTVRPSSLGLAARPGISLLATGSRTDPAATGRSSPL